MKIFLKYLIVTFIFATNSVSAQILSFINATDLSGVNAGLQTSVNYQIPILQNLGPYQVSNLINVKNKFPSLNNFAVIVNGPGQFRFYVFCTNAQGMQFDINKNYVLKIKKHKLSKDYIILQCKAV